MKFTESFDQHKLNYILKNKERFDVRVYQQDYDPFNAPTKLLKKSTNGKVKTSYHQANGRNMGRYFADGGISLQSICREVRHTISSEYYNDVDIINCHPVILRFLCYQNKIECEKLNDYIENREKHIAELMADNEIDRDTAKMIFLSLINGGNGDYNSLKKPTRFIRRFKNETTDILEEISDLYPTEYEYRLKSNPSNPRGSTVNAIMCNWENKILMCILDFYKERGIITDDCVLCFDGIMIPKNEEIEKLISECEKYITEKTNIAVGLKIKPMDQGFELPPVDDYIEYKAFDYNDPYCWLDFDEQYRGATFTSFDEIIEKTREDLNRVFCRVEQGKGFSIKKTDCTDNLIDIIDGTGGCTDLFFNYYNEKGKLAPPLSFHNYSKMFANNMKRYRSIDFAPNNDDPLLFNLWTGFIAHEIQDPETLNIKPIELILKHTMEVYCNGCQESYDYFLDLLYYIIKYPERPLGVSIFIYSKKQGSGKNVLLDFLQEFVFGNNITHYTTGLDSLLEKHNHLIKNKKVVIIDELASASDNFVGNFDKLKSMLTGPQLVINPKGVNQLIIKNVLATFMLSNHPYCVRMEPSCRRFFALKVSEKYVGNKDYFQKLCSTFNQENGNIFFSYIMYRGNKRDPSIRIPPLNKFKKEIISHGWSSSMSFLFDLKTEPQDDEETEISATQLYNDYKDWCNQNNEKVKSNKKFSVDIEDNITKERKAAGIYYDLKSITIFQNIVI